MSRRSRDPIPLISARREDALAQAARAAEGGGCMALLYSGMESAGSGRRSYLAAAPMEHIVSDRFDPLEKKLSSGAAPLENAWFGWLGYGLKNTLESLPRDAPPFIALPDLWMCRFRDVREFAHPAMAEEKRAQAQTLPPPPSVVSLRSNMSRPEYLEKVEKTLERIRSGAFYQANLTRKFFGEFATAPDRFALFARLCHISPAPYSAYLQREDTAILSSSPECFLRVGADGSAESRPIKGSIGRGDAPGDDRENLRSLQASAKDRAENLMIADLMRNDLSRSCVPGSVEVPELCATATYATVHHMYSTVRGQKSPGASTLELVKSCFPPGSMTGAPKIGAMEWCSLVERAARGVYGGAIGWFGGDGSCDLSVVIRTLIIQGKRFEFQVGGGIVADSSPMAEWRETLVKASGISRALNLPPGALEEI